MTNEEALALKSYRNYCTCGGYCRDALRDNKHLHENWCAQFDEYEDWMTALDRMNMTHRQALAIMFPQIFGDLK